MTELYFHHYPTSPFAQKMRCIFGYKGLKWHSVEQPRIMPKPDLQDLTGGYRRIPVLQVGNQIVCDTALICQVLDHLSPSKPLLPASAAQAAQVRTVAQWADSNLFWMGMGFNFQPEGAAYLFKDASPAVAQAFAQDRAAMRAGSARVAPSEAKGAYLDYLGRINGMLQGQPFFFGEQPTLADFSAFHPLWFTRRLPPVAGVLAQYANVLPWMDRIDAFGQGEPSPSDAKTALDLAKQSTDPKTLFSDVGETLDCHGIALGEQVSVTAESFGLEASEGVLVAQTPVRFTIRRSVSNGAQVDVHFPRLGFVLKKA